MITYNENHHQILLMQPPFLSIFHLLSTSHRGRNFFIHNAGNYTATLEKLHSGDDGRLQYAFRRQELNSDNRKKKDEYIHTKVLLLYQLSLTLLDIVNGC